MTPSVHNIIVFGVSIAALLSVIYAICKAIQCFYHYVIRRDRVRHRNNTVFRTVSDGWDYELDEGVELHWIHIRGARQPIPVDT